MQNYSMNMNLRKKGYVECRVTSDISLYESDLERIKRPLEEKTGTCLIWKVTQVPKLELTSRGKFKMIIQKIDNGRYRKLIVTPVIALNYIVVSFAFLHLARRWQHECY